MKWLANLLWMLFLLAMIGCSGGGDTPVAPDTPGDGVVPESAQGPSERVLWGVWGFQYDKKSGEIIAVPKRDIAVHYDITQMLISPSCSLCFSMVVLEYKPIEKYVKIKIGLWNKTQFTGYDLRGFVISNAEGLKLRDPDGYMKIWDDGGAIEVNPFLAFMLEKPIRKFAPEDMSFREFEIDFDSVADLDGVTLVIDASYPGNCREPFRLEKEYQSLLLAEGYTFTIEVNVYDWQKNTSAVYIDATPLGAGIMQLYKIAGMSPGWRGTTKTSQFNPESSYMLWVKAESENAKWAMYDQIEITVAPQKCQLDESNIWEEALKLTLNGHKSGYVCPEDPSDWFSFDVTNHLDGYIGVNIQNGTGSAAFEFYDDPEAEPLLTIPLIVDNGVEIELPPGDLGPGTYYTRILYTGDDPGYGQYSYWNHMQDVMCLPDGNESYLNAFEISAGHGSGIQYVCELDPQDWYEFEIGGGPHRPLEIESLTHNDGLDITIYDELQAMDPEGPNLYEAYVKMKDSIDLNDLGIGPGKYYARVRQTYPTDIEMMYTLKFGVDALEWTRSEWSLDSYEHRAYICVNEFGDFFLAGFFAESVDLDIGPGENIVETMGFTDSYLVKADGDGNYLWSKVLGAVNGFVLCYAVNLDTAGNIYMSGYFGNSVDFDPGDGVEMRDGIGRTAFLLKLDGDGNFVWVKTWGPTDNWGECWGLEIEVDEFDNLYVAGFSYGDIDFDPGPGEDMVITDWQDSFLAKYDTSGNYKWTRSWGSQAFDSAYGLSLGNNGEIFVCGLYQGDTDFDPGPGVDLHQGYDNWDVYLCSYDSAGTYLWARTWGSDGADVSYHNVVHPNGDVSVVGWFSGMTDFDPGPAVDERNVTGLTDKSDAFVSRFDSAGNYLGVYTWGGKDYDWAGLVTIDEPGNIIVYGGYQDMCDFDPGPGADLHTSYGSVDYYLLRINPDGSYGSVQTWGSVEEDFGLDIASYGQGDVFVLGYSGGALDLDPGPGEEYTDGPGPFVSKFNFAE